MRPRRPLVVLVISCMALFASAASLWQAFSASPNGPMVIAVASVSSTFFRWYTFKGENVLFSAYQSASLLWGLAALLTGIGMLLGKKLARVLYIDLLILAIVINLVLFTAVDVIGIVYAAIAIHFLGRQRVLEFFATDASPPADAES